MQFLLSLIKKILMLHKIHRWDNVVMLLKDRRKLIKENIRDKTS